MLSKLLSALVLAVLLVSAAHAESFLVLPDGTGDYPSIQAAVDAASDGDEVLLGTGTFTGIDNRNVRFGGKAITVRSVSGVASSVVIDCQRAGPGAFRFMDDESSDSVVSSLTIIRSASWSGAIFCLPLASPTIRDVVVEDSNIGMDLRGGAATLEDMKFRGCNPPVQVRSGSPHITGCLFEANTVDDTSSRGAISLSGGTTTIENCTIHGNGFVGVSALGVGGIVICNAQSTIRDCLITGNNGSRGAVSVGPNSNVSIERCTISSNGGPRSSCQETPPSRWSTRSSGATAAQPRSTCRAARA